MWKVKKDEDGRDLGFAISCIIYQSISINEFQLWIDMVIKAVNIDHIPSYIFDLSLIQKDKLISKLDEIIGYTPVSFLSENEKDALTGIAYLRNIDVYDPPVSKDNALKALRENPRVLEEFKRFFPFIDLPSLSK